MLITSSKGNSKMKNLLALTLSALTFLSSFPAAAQPQQYSCGTTLQPSCSMGTCPSGKVCDIFPGSSTHCKCIDAPADPCLTAQAPACNAPCGGGKVCRYNGGIGGEDKCVCLDACAGATSPACNATCPGDDQICRSSGRGQPCGCAERCSLLKFRGEEEDNPLNCNGAPRWSSCLIAKSDCDNKLKEACEDQGGTLGDTKYGKCKEIEKEDLCTITCEAKCCLPKAGATSAVDTFEDPSDLQSSF